MAKRDYAFLFMNFVMHLLLHIWRLPCACLRVALLSILTPNLAGHRVQHEVKFLWRLHSKHHAIDTPSPFSTLFIDPTDASLQVGSTQPAAAGHQWHQRTRVM